MSSSLIKHLIYIIISCSVLIAYSNEIEVNGMSREELKERTDLFVKKIALAKKISDETERRRQFQLIFAEYQDTGQAIVKGLILLLEQPKSFREKIDRQSIIDQFIAENSPSDTRPIWIEFLQTYINDSSFRKNFLTVQFFFSFADSIQIPVEDLFLSFQSLLVEAQASATWDQFLMVYIEDISFREWTADFQFAISYHKRIDNIKLDFEKQENVESEVLQAVDNQLILDVFKDQARLGFIERFMFWNEFLELYVSHLSFRQDIYNFQKHLEVEVFESKTLYPTLSNEDIEILSSSKWKEYFIENGEDIFDHDSYKHYILKDFQRFLYDYYKNHIAKTREEIIETIRRTNSKELFTKTIFVGPITIESLTLDSDQYMLNPEQYIFTQMVIAVLQSKAKNSITNQVFTTIKEEETEFLLKENINKQDIVEEFLALLPQDNREDSFWTKFLQLYTANSSFRVWFRQLQTITAPIVHRDTQLSFPMDTVLEELNKLHPSFIEKTKASKWDTFLLAYLHDESFPIQAFEFQTFLAVDYRNKN